MGGLFKLAIVLGLLHFGSAALATMVTPACDENSRQFGPQRCACIKSGYRSSLITERLWISSMLEERSDFVRAMRDDLQRLYNRCW